VVYLEVEEVWIVVVGLKWHPRAEVALLGAQAWHGRYVAAECQVG
jgi:hypothetical protein